MKVSAFLFSFIIILSLGCSKDNPGPDPEMDYKIGKNRYTTEVDGDMREYYVHVPSSYDDQLPTPMVFMMHGATHHGEGVYEISGWNNIADSENIIMVYPTAWSGCYFDINGNMKEDTRWNSFPGVFEWCLGTIPRDDIKFIKRIIQEQKNRFNIDNRKIYMDGFSSGAQMTFRCAVEMSDQFAAVVQSGGTHQVDTILNPDRNIPISFEVGNQDPTWFQQGLFPPLTLFDSLLNNYGKFERVINAHIYTFAYDTSYTVSGDSSLALVATFNSIPTQEIREFNFIFVEGLKHELPNGFSTSYFGPFHHWNWMKKYTLP